MSTYSRLKSRLTTAVPLFLMLFCPPIAILMWYTCTVLNGSLTALWDLFSQHGVFQTLYTIWQPVFFGNSTAWTMLAVFASFQLLLMKIIPGKTFHGPITPRGNIPVYRENGFAAFIITMLAFWLITFKLNWVAPTIIYNNFGELLGALNLFSFIFCIVLYLKGIFAPSTTDFGSSGNVIFDYYWGTELYPRILGWDVKVFTNARFGMMSWGLILLSFAAKQEELYGLSDSMMVAVFLQFVYLTKFFLWEPGYLKSLDIMHDRAGFYICWGCLLWVPGIYTSSTLYLVNHPNHLGILLHTAIALVGTGCILVNYWADKQRQLVRETNGQCIVWGKKPELTMAKYATHDGQIKTNVLLSSGWWGISRHFHYIPEILGAFCWTVPALFESPLPYFYVIFLTCLLTERAFRDDRRCAEKYGPGWNEYCERVPYKIIPYVI